MGCQAALVGKGDFSGCYDPKKASYNLGLNPIKVQNFALLPIQDPDFRNHQYLAIGPHAGLPTRNQASFVNLA